MNLGRYQQGQTVTIGLAVVDANGDPASPITAPTAVITDADDSVVASLKLAMNGNSTAFALGVFLGINYSLGTYTVTYSYQSGAFSGSASDTFTVIPGGDPGGRVISLYAYDRPEARYVVAQLTSGLILQGRNPRL
ncbi:hypothetical protein SAMN05444166_4234 [Singulisphaera sp. GP187]|uniref:hypothetical protein n=1 Tax=Singulisphaera sp. GP187 TaxID=1882752 RepID=UPI0009295AC1|nr:hypothetical protein [Singulisphaera sp. GP187]SIO38004.1 hypothetical protein SAMN05444166_4234 [Singulisphaera sp. GP187]